MSKFNKRKNKNINDRNDSNNESKNMDLNTLTKLFNEMKLELENLQKENDEMKLQIKNLQKENDEKTIEIQSLQLNSKSTSINDNDNKQIIQVFQRITILGAPSTAELTETMFKDVKMNRPTKLKHDDIPLFLKNEIFMKLKQDFENKEAKIETEMRQFAVKLIEKASQRYEKEQERTNDLRRILNGIFTDKNQIEITSNLILRTKIIMIILFIN